MQIIWYGQACFQITTQPAKNSQVALVIDPFSEEIGLKLPSSFSREGADVLLVTHEHYDHSNIKAIKGPPFLIQGPGEYEIKGIFIQGIPAFHDKTAGKERGRITIYTIESEELRICHLGDFGQKELSEEQIEQIGEVDILIVPVGGVYTISPEEAAGIVNQIEPKIVIPMHYLIPKLNIKLEKIDKFLKALGQKDIEPCSKLSIKKKDLTDEKTKVVVLQP